MGRYKVKVGEHFEIYAVDIEGETAKAVLDAALESKKQSSRDRIAISVLSFAFIGIALAGAIGVMSADFSALSSVWAIVSMPLGSVLGYYFNQN